MALLIVVLIATSMSGCFGTPHKITATVAPPTPTPTQEPAPTVTPMPTPEAIIPTVAQSGDTTTITGSRDGLATGVHLGQGVFVVSWTGSGTQLSLSLIDPNSNSLSDLTKGKMSGSTLLIVDQKSYYAGDFQLTAASDDAWSVTITRPDSSSASSLPVTFGGESGDTVVSAPFSASKGDIKIAYSFSHTSTGAGYVNIYDVLTGDSFYVRPITSDSQVGQSNAEVPEKGVYIAQAIIPPGASYGEITISQ